MKNQVKFQNNYIALENVRSLYNVGSIMRTCSFFDFPNLILVGYSGKTTTPKGKYELHPKIKKTALGYEKDLNIIMLDSFEDLYKFAKEKGLKLVAVEQHEKSIDLKDYEITDNSIFVFGNERSGIEMDVEIESVDTNQMPSYIKNACGINSAKIQEDFIIKKSSEENYKVCKKLDCFDEIVEIKKGTVGKSLNVGVSVSIFLNLK